jgi:hypothetical protein
MSAFTNPENYDRIDVPHHADAPSGDPTPDHDDARSKVTHRTTTTVDPLPHTHLVPKTHDPAPYSAGAVTETHMASHRRGAGGGDDDIVRYKTQTLWAAPPGVTVEDLHTAPPVAVGRSLDEYGSTAWKLGDAQVRQIMAPTDASLRANGIDPAHATRVVSGSVLTKVAIVEKTSGGAPFTLGFSLVNCNGDGKITSVSDALNPIGVGNDKYFAVILPSSNPQSGATVFNRKKDARALIDAAAEVPHPDVYRGDYRNEDDEPGHYAVRANSLLLTSNELAHDHHARHFTEVGQRVLVPKDRVHASLDEFHGRSQVISRISPGVALIVSRADGSAERDADSVEDSSDPLRGVVVDGVSPSDTVRPQLRLNFGVAADRSVFEHQ